MSAFVAWLEERLESQHGKGALAAVAENLKSRGAWPRRKHPLKLILDAVVIVQGGLKLHSRDRWGAGIRPALPCVPWESPLLSHKGDRHGALGRAEHPGPALAALLPAAARWRPLPKPALAALAVDLLTDAGGPATITGALLDRFEYLDVVDRCKLGAAGKTAERVEHCHCSTYDW